MRLEEVLKILKFDTFETLFGAIILFFAITKYIEIYSIIPEGNFLFGVIAFGFLLGGLLLADGMGRWKERYNDERRIEKLKNKKEELNLRSDINLIKRFS